MGDPGPLDFDPGGGGGGGGGGDDDNEAEHARPQNAPGAGRLAMQLVLVSISVLFITIAIVYFLRSRTPIRWEPVGVPGFLWLSTALILASSWTLEAARRAFARLQVSEYAWWVLITFFLGLGFLISQLLSLRQLIAQGIYLRRNPHSSLFYLVTGAHGLHLLGGMIALFYLIVRASLATGDVRAELGRQRTLMSVSTLYWHFLDALWVALFILLFVWR
jgi:cytochrome c oxidase subunit III